MTPSIDILTRFCLDGLLKIFVDLLPLIIRVQRFGWDVGIQDKNDDGGILHPKAKIDENKTPQRRILGLNSIFLAIVRQNR
jgi:hypothetical protein